MFGARISPSTLEVIRRQSLGAQAFDVEMFKQFTVEEISAWTASRYIAYNYQTTQFLSRWCAFSNEIQWPLAIGVQDTDFQEVAEGGVTLPSSQRLAEYLSGAFMTRRQKTFSMTKQAAAYLSLGEFNNELESHFRGDRRLIMRQIVRAIFSPTTKTGRDIEGDSRPLTQYAFANGDSRTYPVAWNGNAVSSPHSHFIGRIGGSFAGADIDAGANHIFEHFPGAMVGHYVGWNSGSTVTALSGFVPVTYEHTIPAETITQTDLPKHTQKDETSLDPVALGVWNGRIVYKAWWIPDGYLVTILENIEAVSPDARNKALRFRVPESPYSQQKVSSRLPMMRGVDGSMQPGLGSLQVIQTGDQASIFDATMSERMFGIAPWNPLGVVVTYMGGTSYVEPTIAFA